MPQVFISYARDGSHGERLAEAIQQRFQAADIKVFRDVIVLKPGDRWGHRLEAALKASKIMVLVMSEKACHSDWVYSEVDMAKELKIPIIPVLAEPIFRPVWLRHLQMMDFCQQQDWSTLLNTVKPHLDLQEKPQNQPKQENHKVNKSQPEIMTPEQVTPAYLNPSWASKADSDQYGHYADLNYKGVIQRFRWIEPGRFLMGSPEDEPGRFDREIQHQVSLSKGYWLADTACTQQLWKAVIGNNPSGFIGENLPVETVSWDDTQEFLQKLNVKVPNLLAKLPTEAEWEYACRAGTTSAFSFGGQEDLTLERVNYSGKWDEYDPKGKTKPVKTYPANPWGFYEMHGNVWEWCQDGFAVYPAEPVRDLQEAEEGFVPYLVILFYLVTRLRPRNTVLAAQAASY